MSVEIGENNCGNAVTLTQTTVGICLERLMPERLANPKYWRDRAAETRELANVARSESIKAMLGKLVETYERLAAYRRSLSARRWHVAHHRCRVLRGTSTDG